MIDAVYLSTRLNCSRRDRLDCMDTAETLCDMARLIRKEGPTALASRRDDPELSPFWKACIGVFLDIRDRETARTVLTGYLLTEDCAGKEFLNRLLIVHGTLQLYRQDGTPEQMASVLQGWFGAELSEVYRDRFEEKPAKEPERTSSIYPPFDLLADASMPHLMQLAFQVELSTLALALAGAGREVREQFFDAVSTRERLDTLKSMIAHTAGSGGKDAERAQKFIFEYSQDILDRCPDL